MSDVITPPPGGVAEVVCNLNHDFLGELAFEAASLWRSCEEAAHRGDSLTYSVHLRQVRLLTFTVVRHLEKVFGKDGST
jgi:hypothetical protein